MGGTESCALSGTWTGMLRFQTPAEGSSSGTASSLRAATSVTVWDAARRRSATVSTTATMSAAAATAAVSQFSRLGRASVASWVRDGAVPGQRAGEVVRVGRLRKAAARYGIGAGAQQRQLPG